LLLPGDSGFQATTDFTCVSEMDTVVICVPTPLNEYREPDLRYVTATVKSIAPHVSAGQLVVLESTTYPGTTEEVVLPLLENGNPLKLCVSRDSSEARNVFCFCVFSRTLC
jgi:UDP-N-acetyl-D-glucosamine dehydrogenase